MGDVVLTVFTKRCNIMWCRLQDSKAELSSSYVFVGAKLSQSSGQVTLFFKAGKSNKKTVEVYPAHIWRTSACLLGLGFPDASHTYIFCITWMISLRNPYYSSRNSKQRSTGILGIPRDSQKESTGTTGNMHSEKGIDRDPRDPQVFQQGSTGTLWIA